MDALREKLDQQEKRVSGHKRGRKVRSKRGAGVKGGRAPSDCCAVGPALPDNAQDCPPDEDTMVKKRAQDLPGDSELGDSSDMQNLGAGRDASEEAIRDELSAAATAELESVDRNSAQKSKAINRLLNSYDALLAHKVEKARRAARDESSLQLSSVKKAHAKELLHVKKVHAQELLATNESHAKTMAGLRAALIGVVQGHTKDLPQDLKESKKRTRVEQTPKSEKRQRARKKKQLRKALQKADELAKASK